MPGILKMILGFLGCGGLAALAYFGVSGKKLKIREKLHLGEQEAAIDEMESLQHQKVQVVAKVEDLKTESAAVQEEIRKVCDIAAQKIELIKKQSTTVDGVDSIADEGWDEL